MSETARAENAVGEAGILWQARPDMRLYALIAGFACLISFYPVLRLSRALSGSAPALPRIEIAFALIALGVFAAAAFLLVVIAAGKLRFEYRLEAHAFYVERQFLGRFHRLTYAVPGVRFFRIRRFSALVQAGKPGPDGVWPATSTMTLFSAAQRESLRDLLPEGTFP